MNAEVTAVGSELLLGQITNTNAKFISEQLAIIGVNVYYHTVVGDNPNRLKQSIEIAKKRANLVIFTGGLGPTKDDLTKETIAELLGTSLEFDKKALESIEAYFSKRNIVMTENNRKQALILKGATVLPNENGMAPGMVLTIDQVTYILMPGVPSEMKPMFSNYGIPAIQSLMNEEERIESKVLRFFGIGEAQLEEELIDLIENQSNPTIAPLASDGEVTIRLTAKHRNEKARMELLKQVEEKILNRVGSHLYGYDDVTIIEKMGQVIQNQKMTLSCAESLTGGLFQEKITSIPGVSEWFSGGVVTYSTHSKQSLLGVKEETIDTFGVVSSQCAKEMAENVRKLFNTDIGISFTGVAGPAKLEGKEPGTVYIGLSIKDKETKTFSLDIFGNRDSIRLRTVKNGAWKVIQNISEWK